MNQVLIIGIDPGQTGGISSMLLDTKTNQCSELLSICMPKGLIAINDYLFYLKWEYVPEKTIVFIEKLSMFQSDSNANAHPGMKFQLQKMHKHYAELTTALTLMGLKYYEVGATTWQSRLQLRTKGLKEEKQIRKKRYKQFAQETFPSLKVNLKTADSLCILYYGMLQISNNQKEYLVNN